MFNRLEIWNPAASFIVLLCAFLIPLNTLSAATVTAIVPNQGQEGDLVSIQGQGFGTQPENHAVVIEANGEMIATEVLSASPTELICRITGVDQPMSGSVTVHQGARTLYPNGNLVNADRTHLVHGASWFETLSTSNLETLQNGMHKSNGGTFHAIASGSGFVGMAGSGGLIIGLRQDGGGPIAQVRTDIVTCDSDAEGTGGGSRTEGIDSPIFEKSQAQAIQATLWLQPSNAAAQDLPESLLAEDLAMALNQTFGARGLSAQASGLSILIDYQATGTGGMLCGIVQIVRNPVGGPL